MTNPEFFFAHLGREELANVLGGARPAQLQAIGVGRLPRMSAGDTIVFWAPEARRPSVIVVRQEDRDELFNWASTYHRDLSPLTSWCHVLTPDEMARLSSDGARSRADLLGFEAAWAGAAIAESMVHSQRSYEAISVPACLATDTFAVARAASLYGSQSALSDTIGKLDKVRERIRKGPNRWRPAESIPISVLLRLLPVAPLPRSHLEEVLATICLKIHNRPEEDSGNILAENLRELSQFAPQIRSFNTIDDMPAERRVRLLREIPSWIKEGRNHDERNILTFFAGYIISRVGGAERDLRLAEGFGSLYPLVLTWAAVLGGLGASFYWSDAFGGIGRLVARELARSVDVLEAPTADISADELLVLAVRDGGVVRFRTALRHVATVSLRPGVVVQFSTTDDDRTVRSELVRTPPVDPLIPGSSQTRQLAEQLFPHLLRMFQDAGVLSASGKRAPKRSKSPELPLK